MINGFRCVGLSVCLVLAFGSAVAATASYQYDALGRLRVVDYDTGKVAIYDYDNAGNRQRVVTGTKPGVPGFITVPNSSTTGNYTISWGQATGTVTAYQLFQATNTSFSGETLLYSGSAESFAVSGRSIGTYYYRVRACISSLCPGVLAGANGVVVTTPPPASIQVLNPAISVGASGQSTSISTLANLNGIPATISSFSETCIKASVVIQSGAQSVVWTNNNTFLRTCELGVSEQCSASYVIRNSNTGQTYPGTSAITVVAQGRNLGPGQSCP